MALTDFIRDMPKVEIHVHLQGSTRPETLLKLAQRNNIDIPATTLDQLRDWYAFTDFEHFLQVYDIICTCLQTADDIELLTREFLVGQAEQNIRYTELTYTPPRHIPFEDQLPALNRGREWGERELGVKMNLVIDIPRGKSADIGMQVADFAISGINNGIVAFGIGGMEAGNLPEKFADAFAKTRAAGLPCVPHAGEVVGPESIWNALEVTQPARIGHGVRCLEDPALVDELRRRQIPLEVCPTSNVCLGVVDRIEDHPLPRLMDEGLYVTINSDDPPMFNTTLTDEYLQAVDVFGFDVETIQQLVLNALRVTFLPDAEKASMETEFLSDFQMLREKFIQA